MDALHQPTRRTLRRFLPLLPFLLTTAGLAHAAEPVRIRWDDLRDVNQQPLAATKAPWKIVCVLGAECPLARLYGPRLAQLENEFREAGVRVVGINSNSQDSPRDIQRYLSELELTFPIVKDTQQQLARQLNATRTPEVFLLDATDRIRYRGRIDDQYEPGVSRSAPVRHELRDAIAAVLAGQPIPVEKTAAVGCLITFVKPPQPPTDPAARVTFTRDVAPILFQHCVECHRPGEIGPFALIDYDEVAGWAEMMVEVVEQGRMPPWHADPQHGDFVGARRLPDGARKTLANWLAQGMPEGDPADLPAQPQWVSGWHLPTPPDCEVAMRATPFSVPPTGTVEYQYFVVDPQWKEDRWIRAAQVVPGDAAVVHHAIIFVRPPDGTRVRGVGWLGAYVPGQRTTVLPNGHARLVPAGSKLVFQMHYTPNGRATKDTTKLGVWFSDSDDVSHEVTTRIALDHKFEIPPGSNDHTVNMTLTGFARDSRLLGTMPHMHLRGKSFRLEAVGRDQQHTTLLSVPAYDFNWQHFYQLTQPLPLADIKSFEMQVQFDNSSDNPTNPDPREYVTWGDQTWQEMAVAYLEIAHPRGQPHVYVDQGPSEHREDQAQQQKKIREASRKFLAGLDRNRDGVVEAEEAPEAFRRFGFSRIDRNRDGRLDREEIEAEAARAIRP